MGNQYRDSTDESTDKALELQEKQRKLDDKEVNAEFSDDAFKEAYHTRAVYDQLNREYDISISPKFAHISKARSQFPPYWDDNKGCAQQLPLYQHNVSSGRYSHTMTRLALTYNSSFPNQSLNKKLIELKIIEPPGEPQPLTPAQAASNGAQPQIPSDSPVVDKEDYIEQAFDNVVKQSSWAKREHLKMTDNMLNYGVGVYYFKNPKDYRYKALDYRKIRFPSGTTTVPEEWEYLFIESDISFNELIMRYEDSLSNKPGRGNWNKSGLEQVLLQLLNKQITHSEHSSGNPIESAAITSVDQIREGLSGRNLSKVCAARIPVVSCFWKNKSGKISTNTFVTHASVSQLDNFIFEKDNVYTCFSKAFTVFTADDTEDEIRMVKGWGSKIHTLCHSYDRSFCKFLDQIDIASSIFLTMDPNDIHKKIIHMGSLNIGKFEGVQNLPSALSGIISSLAFLDQKIDQVTFSQGLNKTEMQGEGRGADLMNILLTMEGRVHKHLMSRFMERYTIHYKEVLRKIINISLNEALLTKHGEIAIKFKEFLEDRGVVKEDLQLGDDSVKFNSGLPVSWEVQARKSDNSGITSSIPHVIQTLTPYLSSLPESGFKYLLGRIIADAFGDEDAVQKALPGADISKVSSEADLQTAETQSALLTSSRSEFDRDLSNVGTDFDPRLLDSSKFVTLPATRQSDNIIFLQVLLRKAEESIQKQQQREIGRTTLHIWLFNLISTSKNHVDILSQDAVRSQRPEAQLLIQKFGDLFNVLRTVESQANAERASKLDSLQEQLALQAQDNPKRVEAIAKLEASRAKTAEVQRKFATDQFDQDLKIIQNRRAEEAHLVDQALKTKSLIQPAPSQSQSLVGRPSSNEQRRQ